jgi:hypothetical protein
MGEKLSIPGISETLGEIDKDDWSMLLLEEETVLLANRDDQTKKIWIMNDEWTPKKKEVEPKVVTETLKLEQVEPEQEVKGGVSETSSEVEWRGDQITLESLQQMRLDELLFYAMLQYKEEEIREKIYCLFGHCKNKCGGCDERSSTCDSE